MILRPKIFISHSLHDTDQDQYLDTVVKALEDQGFDAFLDKTEIKRDESFPQQIYEQLLTCHGAIVLLNEKALCSDWVACESFVFFARHFLNPSFFKILRITIGDISPQQLGEGSLSPCRFESFIVSKHLQGKELADAIKSHFGHLAQMNEPQGQAIHRVEQILNLLTIQDHQEACTHMGLDPGGNATKRLASELTGERGLEQLATFIRAWRSGPSKHKLSEDDMLFMLNIIAPLWVDLKAAAPLTTLRDPGFGNDHIFYVIGSSASFLGPCYLRRSTCETLKGTTPPDDLDDGNALRSYYFHHYALDGEDVEDPEVYMQQLREPIATELRNKRLKYLLKQKKTAYLTGFYDEEINQALLSARNNRPFVLILGPNLCNNIYINYFRNCLSDLLILAVVDAHTPGHPNFFQLEPTLCQTRAQHYYKAYKTAFGSI